jgi:hypothetical protein
MTHEKQVKVARRYARRIESVTQSLEDERVQAGRSHIALSAKIALCLAKTTTPNAYFFFFIDLCSVKRLIQDVNRH